MEYHSGGSLPLLGRPRYCPGAKANGGYLCETGHCCGETGCCTYYYELWWFWLLWTVLILFSCCCAYRHRRAKLRVQQQQRQREISLLAYHGAASFPSSMLDLSFLASLKLPSYEEVAAQPSTPPPPYSSVFTAPRYPQPPRASDPHLLTQHGPLLHRRLSDGPSSFSSDNSSSSCSCDSCCPSSPCSSSISAPVTYETDTSHATTPGEATPLTLDVTAETIAAAAVRLEVNETQFVSERTAATATIDVSDEGPTGAQKPSAKDPSGPGSEVALNVVSKSPVEEFDPAVCIPAVSACSLSSRCSPTVDTKLPSIQIISNEDSDDGLKITPIPKTTSVSGPGTSAVRSSDLPAATQVLDLTRTCTASVPSPDVGRTLVLMTGSSELQSPDLSPVLVPIPVPPNSAKASIPEPPSPPSILVIPDLTQSPDPVPSNLSMASNPHPKSPTVPDPAHEVFVSLKPADVPGATDRAPNYQSLDPATEPADSSPSLDPSHSPESDLTSSSPPNVQAALSSGPESGSGPSPVLSSCPAITIECETSLSLPPSPPSALSPSLPSPPPLTSPPALSSILLPAPALLLDPLTGPLQSSKGGSSSGHASSLSPSPRATQSPPKQTLFSPCVDVFEPRPPSWEDEEEEQEDEDNEDDDDEDMGADESQYRHRRLTGDSGIEVCRCRVEEEEEEEEEEEKGGKEEEGGGEVGGERAKKGGGNLDLHDSLDCPARSEMTTGEAPPLCNSTSTPMYEEGVKVVVVMEMV